ncbi:GTP cyclohydrolase I FolE [Spelaeicoccus albus]|uniref:GTP cyclohydrolase 1 n=1 Tax=Spelaeicoccus albus TaxID=1280376 RepID=A0A7Z0D2P8_9MICO|nr:GTP cyclohydrolase I FolE [Spelaeicoccus albus]NYI67772.1 GTP cyclohydrolase I [Spelaeicoccus albus]
MSTVTETEFDGRRDLRSAAGAEAGSGVDGESALLRAAPAIERQAAQDAVRDLLTALGQDVDDPELEQTPRRVADALTEMLSPPLFSLTTFANTEKYDEMVVVRDIPVHSLCAHHMLPFTGIAHVAYLPGDRIVGLSKLARAVELFAHGLQVQERLTTQISNWLDETLRPRGVGVVIEAEHMCMSIRGVQARGARTLTSSLHGAMRTDPSTRAEFLSLVK